VELMLIIDAKAIPVWNRAVFEDMRKGRLAAVNIVCSIWEDFEQSMRRLAELKRLIAEDGDLIYLVREAKDITREDGRTGIIVGWQNSSGFNDHMPFVGLAAELGLRIVQIAFLTANSAACGANETHDRGLSDFGRELVHELNAHAIAIDISHLNAESARDVVAASAAPVFYAQTNPAALNPMKRNRSDEDLRAVVDKGGVVSVASLPPFLGRGDDSSIDDLAQSIVYVLNLVGEEGVAIGTDITPGQPRAFYDYVGRDKGFGRELSKFRKVPVLPELRTFSDYPNLVAALERQKLTASQIERVMGLNLLRYFKTVWGA
jgi:membrane dipeptidase